MGTFGSECAFSIFGTSSRRVNILSAFERQEEVKWTVPIRTLYWNPNLRKKLLRHCKSYLEVAWTTHRTLSRKGTPAFDTNEENGMCRTCQEDHVRTTSSFGKREERISWVVSCRHRRDGRVRTLAENWVFLRRNRSSRDGNRYERALEKSCSSNWMKVKVFY